MYCSAFSDIPSSKTELIGKAVNKRFSLKLSKIEHPR
jgi:hypothetical protein